MPPPVGKFPQPNFCPSSSSVAPSHGFLCLLYQVYVRAQIHTWVILYVGNGQKCREGVQYTFENRFLFFAPFAGFLVTPSFVSFFKARYIFCNFGANLLWNPNMLPFSHTFQPFPNIIFVIILYFCLLTLLCFNACRMRACVFIRMDICPVPLQPNGVEYSIKRQQFMKSAISFIGN